MQSQYTTDARVCNIVSLNLRGFGNHLAVVYMGRNV